MEKIEILRNDLYRAAGQWRRISAETNIHYDSVSRIARGYTSSPSVENYFALRAWLDAHLPPDPTMVPIKRQRPRRRLRLRRPAPAPIAA